MSQDLGVCTVLEALEQVVGEFAGKTVVDVGSGEGRLARQLAEAGAVATGIDPLGPEQDWTDAHAGRFRLICRGAEVLPMEDASIDLALFNFSLHHIPSPILPGILREVRRVVRADGALYVAEPLAEGPAYEVSLLYHDETEVRRLAAETLSSLAPGLFTQHQVFTFRRRTVVLSYEHYIANMTATIRYNDFTEAELHSPAVKDRFSTVSARVGGVFDQPVRVDLLRP